MRIVICDDDPVIIEQLNKYILEFFSRCNVKCPLIAAYPDGESLLSDTEEKDIVFLDIEMPGLDGIYVANTLKKDNPNMIVFIVTSYMEYLDEAMRVHVFRYLSKPLDKQRLFRNMKDALRLYHSLSVKISVETKEKTYAVPVSDIVFIETQGRRTIVHTTTDDFESTQNMHHWLKALSTPCFFQPHKSFLINLEHVTDFDHSTIHLYHSQFEAYLTRRRYTQFKESYLLYLEGTR